MADFQDEGKINPGSSTGVPVMGMYEVSPDTLTDKEVGLIAIDANRRVITSPTGGSSSIGTTGTPNVSQIVDGTTTTQKAAVDPSGNISVKLGVTPTVNAGTGFVGTTTTPNVSTIADPTTPTQQANVIAPGTGQNSLLTAGSFKEIAFTTTTVQAVASMDVSNYKWVSVQVASQGGSSNITFQISNDNINWVSTQLQGSTSGANQLVASTTGTGIFIGPLNARYFRLNVTGIASGTTAGVIELYTMATVLPSFGVAASQVSTWIVQPGNTPNTSPWLVQDKPATSGGLTMVRLISAATTNATSSKPSAGQLYQWDIYNTSASAKYVKLYNKASAPTVGTDTPVKTIQVPANGSASLNVDKGLAFATGIAFAITGAASDSDATAVAAGDIILNLGYN